MLKLTLSAESRKRLSSVSSALRAAMRGSRDCDAVAVFSGGSRAAAAVSSACADALARAFLLSGDDSKTVPAAVVNDSLRPFVARIFPGTADLPTLADARRRRRDGEETDADAFLLSVHANANGRIRAARKANGDGPTATASKPETVTVRLTAPDRAALERDGSITVTVSEKRRVRIVLA